MSPSELVSNGYISNHNKMRRPRPKFKVSFYLYFCCFWINVTQINFENIKRKIQRIIFGSCFQLKLWFNVDARVPSIPLLNFPFNSQILLNRSGSTAFYSNFIFWYITAVSELTCLNLTIFSYNDYYASVHGCFPVKFPNYFIAEAPSNPLLNLPFNWILLVWTKAKDPPNIQGGWWEGVHASGDGQETRGHWHIRPHQADQRWTIHVS